MYKVKAITVWYNNDLKLQSKPVDDETDNLEMYREKQKEYYQKKYRKDISVDLIHIQE